MRLPLDALVCRQQRGEFAPIEPAEGEDAPSSAQACSLTERHRERIIPLALDAELILSGVRDVLAPTGRPGSVARFNFLFAAEWLLSDQNRTYLFSFPSICARLGLNERRMAAELLRQLDASRLDPIQEHFEEMGIQWLSRPLPKESS